MYVKYVSAKNTNEYTRGTFFADLAKLLNGTITDPSQFSGTSCNRDASYITGTPPTTGIYSASPTSHTDNTSDNYYINIEKYHYAKGNPATFLGRSKVRGDWDDSYYCRFRHQDKDSGNANYTSSGYWGQYNNTSYTYTRMWRHFNEIEAIHMIINDTTFYMCWEGTGTTEAVKDHSFFLLQDIEYIQDIDNYHYTSNNKSAPMISAWGMCRDAMYSTGPNGTTQTNTDNHRFGMYRPQYPDRGGTYRNQYTSDSSQYSFGYKSTLQSNYCTWQPTPNENQEKLTGANGDTHHLMVPLQYDGNMKSETGDPRRGTLMNIYRTTDDTFMDGDVLIDGTTRYRVLRMHKCGDESFLSSPNVAFYAFPENNVPFAT